MKIYFLVMFLNNKLELDSLPSELILNIFYYLNLNTLYAFSLTGRRYYNLYIDYIHKLKIRDKFYELDKKSIDILNYIYEKYLSPDCIDVRYFNNSNCEILIKYIYNEKNDLSFYFNKNCVYLSSHLENIKYIIKCKKIDENMLNINKIKKIKKIFDNYIKKRDKSILNNNLFSIEKSKIQKEDLDYYLRIL